MPFLTDCSILPFEHLREAGREIDLIIGGIFEFIQVFSGDHQAFAGRRRNIKKSSFGLLNTELAKSSFYSKIICRLLECNQYFLVTFEHKVGAVVNKVLAGSWKRDFTRFHTSYINPR